MQQRQGLDFWNICVYDSMTTISVLMEGKGIHTFQSALNFRSQNVVELCIAWDEQNVDGDGRVDVGQAVDGAVRQLNTGHGCRLPPVFIKNKNFNVQAFEICALFC